MRKPFEKSVETSAIESVFCAMMMSERMSFTELSRKVGFKVVSTLPAYQSAKRIVERDHKIYIASERGIGFFRGNGPDMAGSVVDMNSRAKNIGQRMLNRGELAREHNLPEYLHNQNDILIRRASIILETTGAPLPQSNRKRRAPVPQAEPVSRAGVLARIR